MEYVIGGGPGGICGREMNNMQGDIWKVDGEWGRRREECGKGVDREGGIWEGSGRGGRNMGRDWTGREEYGKGVEGNGEICGRDLDGEGGIYWREVEVDVY